MQISPIPLAWKHEGLTVAREGAGWYAGLGTGLCTEPSHVVAGLIRDVLLSRPFRQHFASAGWGGVWVDFY